MQRRHCARQNVLASKFKAENNWAAPVQNLLFSACSTRVVLVTGNTVIAYSVADGRQLWERGDQSLDQDLDCACGTSHEPCGIRYDPAQGLSSIEDLRDWHVDSEAITAFGWITQFGDLDQPLFFARFLRLDLNTGATIKCSLLHVENTLVGSERYIAHMKRSAVFSHVGNFVAANLCLYVESSPFGPVYDHEVLLVINVHTETVQLFIKGQDISLPDSYKGPVRAPCFSFDSSKVMALGQLVHLEDGRVIKLGCSDQLRYTDHAFDKTGQYLGFNLRRRGDLYMPLRSATIMSTSDHREIIKRPGQWFHDFFTTQKHALITGWREITGRVAFGLEAWCLEQGVCLYAVAPGYLPGHGLSGLDFYRLTLDDKLCIRSQTDENGKLELAPGIDRCLGCIGSKPSAFRTDDGSDGRFLFKAAGTVVQSPHECTWACLASEQLLQPYVFRREYEVSLLKLC